MDFHTRVLCTAVKHLLLASVFHDSVRQKLSVCKFMLDAESS